ncbi:serine hydrolase [Chryseobacterium oryctis]|uniref:Serine hydrolase n=1 Tax=Chryseobacterium oryctis TaxID=2952618 RepID=A0ABT3HQD7_9FLAO|nr:serine hydrolase [Chryseobacterium oryctis]MCW3161833.1 serine hydrolase [Chryseobacterium oryctis]
MKQILLSVLILNTSSFIYSQQTNQSKLIDNYIKEIIKNNQIPGLALGIIKNDKIVFEQYYGIENLEDKKNVSPSSMFRVYSTSKLMSNVGVFQLIEQGKLSLEDNVSKYVDNLPQDWQNVKVKNLLTHSSGIPDFIYFNDILPEDTNDKVIERLAKEKMDFATGNEYRYNQTNYMLLTMIIEKITSESFNDFIITHQLSDVKDQVYFSSNSLENIPNRVQKYIYNPTTKQYDKSTFNDGMRAHSANGLAITLPAFLKWSNHLNNNALLTQKTKEMMWKPFDFANKKDIFAYGWEISTLNKTLSYGFSGGNVSAYRVYPQSNMSIIIMSNGYNFFPVQNLIINHIAGIVDKNLINHYTLAEESIISEFSKKNNPKAEKNYYNIKANNPKWNFESTLNIIGYSLQNTARIDEAIKIFALNAKEHPQSSNAYNSLGDSYFSAKNYILSLKNYKKSLELDPQNTNAVNMISKIEDLIKKK